VVIDTRPKEATLALQYPTLSPSGHSPRKTLTLTPSISVPEEVSSWSLSIYDPSGKAVRTYLGTDRPQAIAFDGKDDAGKYLPDGELQAVHAVREMEAILDNKGDLFTASSRRIRKVLDGPAEELKAGLQGLTASLWA